MGDKKRRKSERQAQQRLERMAAQEQPSGSQLPASVAQENSLPDTLNFLDGSNYQLIFERYNHGQSGLHDLDSAAAKAMITKLSMITKFNSKTIGGSHLIRDSVINAGSYAPLYEGLEDDIDLKEIQFAGTGRIFCYFVNNYTRNGHVCNYCCVIAIKRQHT